MSSVSNKPQRNRKNTEISSFLKLERIFLKQFRGSSLNTAGIYLATYGLRQDDHVRGTLVEQRYIKSKRKLSVFFICMLMFSSIGYSNCQDSEKAEVINYIPTIVTGSASLAVTGIGYVADGTIFLVGNLLATGVICGAPTLVSAGFDASLGAHVFQACSDVVMRSEISDMFDTDLGPDALKATRKWRCPMFVKD